MDNVIQVGTLFRHRERVTEGIERLQGLALRQIGPGEPAFKRVSRALRHALLQPQCPEISLTDVELVWVAELIDRVADWRKMLNVSLLRFKRETGFDPMNLPFCEVLSRDNETYLCLLEAFGIVALAWQADVHQNNMVFTDEDLQRVFPV